MTAEIEDKARSFIERTEAGDRTSEALQARLHEVSGVERAFAGYESDWAAEGPAALVEVAQVRSMLSGLLLPALERIRPLPPEEQARTLNLMVPFDSDGGLNDFLLHFFQLATDDQGVLRYDQRDPFERDLFILHDLYKVKKTLEVVETIRHAGRDPATRFASRFPPDEQLGILNRLEEVLLLMFTQTLPQRHRQQLMDTISPALLSAEALLERRESGLLYTFPHVLERYDYRRFFFLIYFKLGLKAKFENEDRTYRYNFLHFQWLKREFLIHWLATRLAGNPRKFKLYSRHQLHGKSLLAWITEQPEKESELLMDMPTAAFNGMVAQVNGQVAGEDQIGFEPETERFGLYRQLREKLHEAAALARAPIQTLRAIVADQKAERERAAAAAPAPAPALAMPTPAEAASASAAPARPRPAADLQWTVTLLDAARIANPFLLPSASGYPAQLAALKTKLGPAYDGFAQLTSTLLENTPEMNEVRRRTPRHEWTLPYYIKHRGEGAEREYLLVLGAEVKAKPRGMGYQNKEAYSFSPYFVFAALEAEEGFGAPIGERKAVGKAFQQYAFTQPAVLGRARELLQHIREKHKM